MSMAGGSNGKGNEWGMGGRAKWPVRPVHIWGINQACMQTGWDLWKDKAMGTGAIYFLFLLKAH